jgi:hypothetical protein
MEEWNNAKTAHAAHLKAQGSAHLEKWFARGHVRRAPCTALVLLSHAGLMRYENPPVSN